LHEVAAEQAKGGKQRLRVLVRENPIRQTKPTQGEPVECSMEPRARRGKGVAPRCSDYPSTLYEAAAEQAKGGKQREGCCEFVRENPIGQTKPTQGEPVGCSMEPRARRGKGVAFGAPTTPPHCTRSQPIKRRVVSSGKGVASSCVKIRYAKPSQLKASR